MASNASRASSLCTASAVESEDFQVRLRATSTGLDCNTAFTSLKHAATAHPFGAFAVQSTPVQLPLQGVKDVSGNVTTVANLSLRTNFAGWFQVHVTREATSTPAIAHRTDLRKNGTSVAQSKIFGSGQLSHSIYLLSGDTLSVWISLPDVIAPSLVDVASTRTYVTVAQM